ncbi:MAG TPA: CBS domain-containing protein [Acidimicrobiales bacterium]|nr:CBS domain-containing protein [Acidimicrobiales bacterium]
MRIEELLRRKGADVVTVKPRAKVASALEALARHNIGALVVSSDGVTVEGILSERDIVRRLHETGADVLAARISTVMSAEVLTCEPDAQVDSLVALMTNHRVRHVPVVEGGVLRGIVSIGDVVKSRMDELETDRRALEDYIHAR